MNESRQEAWDNRASRVRWLTKNTKYGQNTAMQLMTDREIGQAYDTETRAQQAPQERS